MDSYASSARPSDVSAPGESSTGGSVNAAGFVEGGSGAVGAAGVVVVARSRPENQLMSSLRNTRAAVATAANKTIGTQLERFIGHLPP